MFPVLMPDVVVPCDRAGVGVQFLVAPRGLSFCGLKRSEYLLAAAVGFILPAPVLRLHGRASPSLKEEASGKPLGPGAVVLLLGAISDSRGNVGGR